MPLKPRLRWRYRILLVGLLAVLVLGVIARRPRPLTREELRVTGFWTLRSPAAVSPLGDQHLTLYAERRYDLAGPAGPAGLIARESGEWNFANGRLRLYSDDAPLNGFQGLREFQWSTLSERWHRLRHGPRPRHLIDLTIESEDQLRSPGAVWIRIDSGAARRTAKGSPPPPAAPATEEGDPGE